MDWISAAIFLVFSVLMLVWIIPAAIPVAFVPPGQIGPRFWPTTLSAAITVIALLMLVFPLMKRIRDRLIRAGQSVGPEAVEEKIDQLGEDSLKKGMGNGFRRSAPWITAAIIALYFLLFMIAGFIISSAFTIVATMLVFGERRWWAITILALAVPLLMWMFAVQVLHLPMSSSFP
jgi:hypothetical protein